MNFPTNFRYLLVNHRERRVVLVESILSPTEFRDTLARALFLHFEVSMSTSLSLCSDSFDWRLVSGPLHIVCPISFGFTLYLGYQHSPGHWLGLWWNYNDSYLWRDTTSSCMAGSTTGCKSHPQVIFKYSLVLVFKCIFSTQKNK